MNAHNSLLDNFSNMHDEFNSSNNRAIRRIDELLNGEFNDLIESLNYFNCEYLVIDKRVLEGILRDLKKNIMDVKVAHVSKYQKNFGREIEVLKQSMCNFFELKLK